MQLKNIEDGERLFDRHMSGMYPGATDSLILWFLTYGHALLAAARNEISARTRADKAKAELAKVRETLETIHTEMIAWAPDNSMSPGEYSDAQQIMEWRNQIGDVIA